MDPCPFCDQSKIASPVEIHPALVSMVMYDVMVFEPLGPVVPGHLLVVPVRHVADAAEDPQVSAAAMKVAARVAGRYDSANIITSIGAPATQTVRHLHLHVVPRAEGDGLALPWTGQTRE